MANPILEITDGTTTVNLLNKKIGLCLKDWERNLAQLKGGGTYRSSPLTPGRRLVSAVDDSISEALPFDIRGHGQDGLIEELQKVLRLLLKARNYWLTRWQDDIIYIRVRAACETNIEYAEILNFSIPGLTNPFGQPFFSATEISVMTDITLGFERNHWLENDPEGSTAIETSSEYTYESVDFGRGATTTNEVYIANKGGDAGLTHIFTYDATGPAWSANLINAAKPFELFPNPAAVGDRIYIGIEEDPPPNPFSSVVFDIGTAASATAYTILWEYYSSGGPGFTPLTIENDSTSAFSLTGVGSLHFKQPPTWTTVAMNGVVASWIRGEITALTGALTIPTQQNRNVYTVIDSAISIDEAQVPGDIPALLLDKLTIASAADTQELATDRTILGLRTVSRGENFAPYLNTGGRLNPTGVVVSHELAYTSSINNMETTAGRFVRYVPIGVETDPLGRLFIDFASILTPEYYGDFHVYFRGRQNGGSAGDIGVRLSLSVGVSSNYTHIGKTVYFPDTSTDWLLMDLGLISIPGREVLKIDELGEGSSGIRLNIEFSNSNAGLSATGDVYDIILMPVDEWAGDFPIVGPRFGATAKTLWNDDTLEIDSVRYPKNRRRARAVETASNPIAVNRFYQYISNGEAMLQANATQKMWTLAARISGDNWVSEIGVCYTIQMEKNSRWLGLRGSD